MGKFSRRCIASCNAADGIQWVALYKAVLLAEKCTGVPAGVLP